MSEKGRWFRVYALQVRDHRKFRSLTGLEIGAWTVLRCESELRAGAVFADRDEAVLVLKRRKIPRPGAVLDRLIDLGLFDIDEYGRIHVHDRADHDRPQYPSDAPEAVAERKRRSRAADAGHDEVTSRDENGHDTHARVQPQPTSPATANSKPPQPDGLPADDDTATAACRMFVNGGRWLDDREYVAAWEDMDRRFSKSWVLEEIPQAYAELYHENAKVKPWDLARRVELRCAERARREELERERKEAEEAHAEAEAIRLRAENATEEEKHRADVTRRAIGLWLRRRPTEPVPTEYDELAAWLEQNERVAA